MFVPFQKVSFIELPDTPTHAPKYFFITPKLIGCNIFVAYDVELHKYFVIRVSGKTPESEENKKEKVN